MQIGDYEIQVPFVPTAVESVKTALELSGVQKGQRVVDLGSGNGRVVIEFAKRGANVDGYELKEHLVLQSREKISEAGLTNLVTIHQKSFWDANLSDYDIVYLYGMNSIMQRLEEKLRKEARPGTKVVSNVFRFPHLHEKKEKENVRVYIIH